MPARRVITLPPAESARLRQAYLDAFVDTTCEHYQRYIGTRQQFSDGIHYTGYIWDCLRHPTRLTYRQFRQELLHHADVYVIADDHSRDRILGAPLWPYQPYSVISLRSTLLLQLLPALPEH